MKLLTLPFQIVARLLAVTGKLIVATGEVGYRAGYVAGSVPVKGGAAVSRALGPKAMIMLVLGIVLGGVIGWRLVSMLAAPPAVLPSVPDLPDEVAVDV